MSVSFVGRHVISNHDIDQRCPLHVGRHKCNFYTTNLYTNFYTKQFFLQLIIFTLTRFYIIDTSYARQFLHRTTFNTRQPLHQTTLYNTHLLHHTPCTPILATFTPNKISHQVLPLPCKSRPGDRQLRRAGTQQNTSGRRRHRQQTGCPSAETGQQHVMLREDVRLLCRATCDVDVRCRSQREKERETEREREKVMPIERETLRRGRQRERE